MSPDQFGNGGSIDNERGGAHRILTEHNIFGRAADLLERSLICYSREHQVTKAVAIGTFMFDTSSQRTGIVDHLRRASRNTKDPLMENRGLWDTGNFLTFNILNHTISGERGKIIEDAQVSYLLAALSLAAWGKTKKKDATAKEVNPLPMNKVAEKAVSATDWKELSAGAREFANSRLAKHVHDIAEESMAKDTGLKTIIDRLLEAYAIMEDPDAVMEAALEIYEKIYGINLRPAFKVDSPASA
ncbi:MAG: hypothetical protein M1308_23270 [Actinobacteria bacterium]|nr:hypothetical protein [Actinomycetota bacterium]